MALGPLIPRNGEPLRELQPSEPAELLKPISSALYNVLPAQESTLREYLRVLIKRKWLVIGCVVGIFAVVAIASLRQTPVYEAVGYAFVQAMFKAGRNPTRADLITAIQGGLPQGPAMAPYSYSSSDHMGITGAYLGVIQNGQLVQQGPVLTTDASASGAITTYSGSEQQAPASGIPSP